MKKIVLFVFLISSLSVFAQNNPPQVQAQDDTPRFFWDNVRFGGGLGFGFGNRSTTIDISPSAIYDFQNGFALGLGVGYLYSKVDEFRANVFTPSAIMLYNPAEQIQLSAEFEQLFVNRRFGDIKEAPFNYPALYLGVAYRTGWAAFGVRYDVLFDENDSIFASAFSPIIRVYF